MPLWASTMLVGGLGVLVATQLNRAIYRWAWFARPIGPWSAPHPEAPPRTAWDRIPILGWCLLSRESSLHGKGYWVRPLFIELGTGLLWSFLYLWETMGGLLPLGSPMLDSTTLHACYTSHVCLLSLMTIATFIDIDEQTIPDLVTLPGALLGMCIAAVLPQAQLPIPDGASLYRPLLLNAPQAWPTWLTGTAALGTALALYLSWWFAIWPRKTWTLRRGLLKAWMYLGVSLFRFPGWKWLAGLLMLGLLGVTVSWRVGGLHWESLLSSLVGACWGGLIVWSVRVVGGQVLGREAMGFGDVTLLAMIGAFLGWQPVSMVFFLAPFAGAALAVLQRLLTGENAIAFGPFLCAAALMLIVGWPMCWQHWAARAVWIGWWIPVIGLVCLLFMGLLLWLFRLWSTRSD